MGQTISRPPRTCTSVRMFSISFFSSIFFFCNQDALLHWSRLCVLTGIQKSHVSVSIQAPCPPVLRHFWRYHNINRRSSEDHALVPPLRCTPDHLNPCSGFERKRNSKSHLSRIIKWFWTNSSKACRLSYIHSASYHRGLVGRRAEAEVLSFVCFEVQVCSELIFWPWLKVLMLVAVFLLDLGKNMFLWISQCFTPNFLANIMSTLIFS